MAMRVILYDVTGKPYAILVSVISEKDTRVWGNFITKVCRYERVRGRQVWQKNGPTQLVAREEQLQQAWK